MLVVGVKFGADYLLSDKFEDYANQTKEPMTCQFENTLGYLHMMMSEYKKGYYRFSHTIDRCPDTPVAETAEFNLARCLEGMGERDNAVRAYDAFAKKYPNSDRAKIAYRASGTL